MIQFLRRVSFIWYFVAGISSGTIVALLFVRGDLGHFVRSTVHAAAAFFPQSNTPFGAVRIHTRVTDRGLYLKAKCVRCVIENDRLAKVPFISTGARLFGSFQESKFSGTISAGEVKATIDTSWEKGEGKGKFVLNSTPIIAIYRELSSIVPEVDKARIEGTVSGVGTFSWPSMIFSLEPKVNKFKVLGLISEKVYRRGGFQYYRRAVNGQRWLAKSGEGSADWLSYAAIGRLLPQAIVAAEDGAFYGHGGYDLSSIVEAAEDNKKSGQLKRGGSTLTQQLAKNLFLDGEKTYARKLRELLYAVELEQDLGKRRILELYMNIVEWGPNIYGAKAAASKYFGKSPNDLLPEEAAWLATILRNPRAGYHQQYSKGKPSMWRVRLALQRMRQLSDSERQAALSRQVQFKTTK